ncbi:hypothetical protein K1Y80_03685 [Streptomyces sp. MAG02]|nr:hypothetical protein [Streptomyces sp. MAG02]
MRAKGAAHGTKAPVTDRGAVGHDGAFEESVPQIVRLFDSGAGTAQYQLFCCQKFQAPHGLP